MKNTVSFFSSPVITDFSAKKFAFLQFAEIDEIEKIQTRLFLHHLKFTVNNSPFYKKLYKNKNIDLKKIKKLSDIEHLPLTEKSDLIPAKYFLCVDNREIVDVCLTSATSGPIPSMISLTSGDLSRLAYNEELAFDMAGIDDKDTLLICAAIDRCFMAGIAYFLGGVKLKARVLRSGSGSAAQHWELIKLADATVIVGVPSLIYKIGQHAIDNNETPGSTLVKKLIAIGEPTRDEHLNLLPIAVELEKMWGAKIYSTYASSEMATTFCECSARRGGHLRPELNITEILDNNGHPVKEGERGEVVVTPLGVTGMPLIRFKTGDISYLINEKCSCGRTTKRIAPILGRKNQMLKYKGTTIFPNAILACLEGDQRFHNGYIEVRKNKDGTDRILLFAALCSENNDKTWISDILRAKIRVVPEIKLIDKKKADKKVYQFDKKRKRMTFFDLR
ncbi:MAG: AMP-binding protein [Proteobacteria bacterium]|nr:AMP-binding protein [Pseudomonadota bacterium]MBU1581714.1 AMP-binding protein [Pseudomonadota bacterium]MBU2455948.1 AMP-binding protein [Pseudomonadota bacterium]MBU2630120.1 AMP-binding protein [Pseudomonadota bacterium]